MKSTRFPLRLSRPVLLGGMLWILSLEFFVGQAVAQFAWVGPPPYSIVSDAVSNLGVTACGTVSIGGASGYYCSPLYYVMNASFVVTGLALLLGLWFARAAWPTDGAMKAGLALVAVAGAGKVVVGLSPANVDFTVHVLGSLGIIVGDIGMIVTGRALLASWRGLGRVTEVLGVVGLLGILVFFVAGHSGFGGVLERVGDYPLVVWAGAVGLTLVMRWRRQAVMAAR